MMEMESRNEKDIIRAFKIRALNYGIRKIAFNINNILKNEQLFYLTRNPKDYKVGGRTSETGDYQFYVRYDGFKHDERFRDLDFGDVDYIECIITVDDALIDKTAAFNYINASLDMRNLEHKMVDLLKEIKRGN